MGTRVLSAGDSSDARSDAAAQRRRLDPQNDPGALPRSRAGASGGTGISNAAVRARAARFAGGFFRDAGMDGICAEVSRSVVGPAAVAAGGHAFRTERGAPDSGGRIPYHGFRTRDFIDCEPQAAAPLEGDAAEEPRRTRSSVRIRL